MPYVLVVTDIITALEIIERDWSDSIWEIVLQLVLCGIPFHTLVTTQEAEDQFKIKDDGEIAQSSKPIIWSNVVQVLQRGDVASYWERIKDVLHTPRRRKALSMGGVVW